MDKAAIEQLIEQYGRAISTGDLPAISNCWEVPAFVISEQGARPVTSQEQIENYFAQADKQYRAQGLVATAPTVEQIIQLSPGLAAVDVLWIVLDALGEEKSKERFLYIVRQDEAGKPHIQVAVTKQA